VPPSDSQLPRFLVSEVKTWCLESRFQQYFEI
jgi:hypothetical protein